jgi:hypothetical protein
MALLLFGTDIDNDFEPSTGICVAGRRDRRNCGKIHPGSHTPRPRTESGKEHAMASVSVRSIVGDVDAAIELFTGRLFEPTLPEARVGG